MLIGSLCTSRSFLGRQKDRMLIRQPLMPMLVVDPGKPIPFDGGSFVSPQPNYQAVASNKTLGVLTATENLDNV